MLFVRYQKNHIDIKDLLKAEYDRLTSISQDLLDNWILEHKSFDKTAQIPINALESIARRTGVPIEHLKLAEKERLRSLQASGQQSSTKQPDINGIPYSGVICATAGIPTLH